MNRTPSMRRRYEAAQQDRWLFPFLALCAFAAVTFVDSGTENPPVITSESHREWVAEHCTRAQDKTALQQCAEFLRETK